MSPDPLISVRSFSKAYEGVPAVERVSFSVKPGEILGVIGPNGAGKTTTMRALATLIPPSDGEMTVEGFDTRCHPVEVKRRLAYIPDDPRLFPHLTVEEHLTFAAAAYGVSQPDEKAARLLEDFELSGKRKTAARDLSRGMRQKLAICSAYLYEPSALLFDEPLTGLDPIGIRTLKQSIVQRAQAGAAVMVSSHLLAMVEDICTHILLLGGGQQRFFGTVDELRLEFADHGSASLEQIFFLATGETDAARQPGSSADSAVMA
ncbi:MAG: ABC transporter ATP-binding protein [Planctomycetaceae bacterium]|nr:ABC transporter ATP-binding protein [Planctomycetaceae bacterium]